VGKSTREKEFSKEGAETLKQLEKIEECTMKRIMIKEKRVGRGS